MQKNAFSPLCSGERVKFDGNKFVQSSIPHLKGERYPNNRPKEGKEVGIKILKTITYEDRYIGGERCQMARKFGSQKSADVTPPKAPMCRPRS